MERRFVDLSGHEIAPPEFVVVNTRAGSRCGSADNDSSGCGMGYHATMHLLEPAFA